MLKFLASFLLFLVLNIGSSKGINVAGFAPAQAPATAPFVPDSPPTAAPPTASFGPTQAPAIAPPLHHPPPPPPPPQPLPPREDVIAVNALLRLAWMPGAVLTPIFEFNDCRSYKFWPKIWCNCNLGNNTCRVASINLRGQNLRGQLPEQIGNLTALTSLDLSSNKLKGSIPESLVNLSQLSVLKLNKNNYQGPIPRFLAKMKALQTLDLSDNSFNGSIPYELGNLTSLKYLYLGNNLLNESIPPDLGNISSLRLLDLHDNELSGQLPEQLGNLTNLQDVDLSNNNLTGTFPPSFQKLRMLQNFNVRGNSFNGTIPDFISNWTNLGKLILSGNNFSGPPLPAAITALTNLTYLFITDMAGEGTNFSIPELNNTLSWETLILRNCSLNGSIPTFIWNLRSLSYLDLSFNNLFGGIPIDVKPKHLKSIFLRKNKLNGTLPGWLTNLTDSHVDVSENIFTNVTIPTVNISRNLNLFECCNTSNQHLKWQQPNYFCDNDAITYDHLYINCGGDATSINGSNYEADMKRDGASTFSLSDNKAWAYSSMGTFADTNQKDYILNETCNITMVDAPLYMDARVSPISLKYYGFCLKNGNYTLKLHFAEIGLDESKVANIKSGRVFDVDIQGGQHYLKDFNIEKEAKGVDKDKTEEFNISVHNRRLEVHLYWSGKGSTPTRYYGPLISAISLSPVLKEHKKLPPSTIGVIAGSATLFVGLVLALFWKLGWLHKDEEFGTFELFPGEEYNFQDIKSATENFHPNHMIGEGGIGAVYKAKLPNETQLAVKRISATSKRGAQKFIKEIVTIYALQHPNLVSLKGCCAKQKELLLIHEYMEKGSLGHVLSEVKSSLNWLRRLQICQDVAKGLVFLHEKESKRQIIHSDIKPTNILLDKDFKAKISDFGYAELKDFGYAELNAKENTRKIEKKKGSSLYEAPEHEKGFLTPKADVYSFGILMLEIISGRPVVTSKGNDSDYLLDKAYVYKEEDSLINLLDDDLKDYTYNEALKILNLAMKCVSHSAEIRPTMPEVAKVLEEVLKVEESKEKEKNKAASSQSTQAESTSQEAISSSIPKQGDDLITSAD